MGFTLTVFRFYLNLYPPRGIVAHAWVSVRVDQYEDRVAYRPNAPAPIYWEQVGEESYDNAKEKCRFNTIQEPVDALPIEDIWDQIMKKYAV